MFKVGIKIIKVINSQMSSYMKSTIYGKLHLRGAVHLLCVLTHLHVGGGALCLLLLVPSHHLVLFLVLIDGSVPQLHEELLKYHVLTQEVLTEPHHATSADDGIALRSSTSNIMWN